MQIDANDDDVVFLEVFAPPATVAAASKVDAAKKIRIELLNIFFCFNEHILIFLQKYACDFSPKQYDFAVQLQIHLRTHKTVQKIKEAYNYMLIMVEFSSLQKFNCEWPGCTNKTGFASAKSLSEHKRRYHGGNIAKAECPECGKSVLRSNLNAHMKIHTGDAKVECKICKVPCSNKANFNMHSISLAYEHQCILSGCNKLSAFYH